MALILNNPNSQVQSNLISVRPSDATQTDMEFAHFMRLAESWLNDASEADRQLFRKCNGTEMEHIALKALKDVAPQTSFCVDNIKLVSGLHFPDIQAAGHFGVEVKSTSPTRGHQRAAALSKAHAYPMFRAYTCCLQSWEAKSPSSVAVPTSSVLAT